MRFIIGAIIVSLLCIPAWSGDYDASPFAMNGQKFVHGGNTPKAWKDAYLIAKHMKGAGIYWDRFELWWGVVEPEKGKFDWPFADKMVRFYRNQGIHALPILCYSSKWSKGVPPSDPDERARYANYVYRVVSRYKDTIKVWAIWNEPNIPGRWPKKPDVKQYTLLLQESYRAAKKADPHCVILAGSTSGPDIDFIKGIYENGGWDFCDAIAIHSYSMCGGPVDQRLDKLLRIHQEYIRSKGKPKPLWITEMGWCTYLRSYEQDQATYLVESYVIAIANGVEKLFWFDFADWAEKWGLVRKLDPLRPKPAYTACRMLTKTLGSPGKCAEFQGYLSMPKDVACYVFKKPDGQLVLILWTNDMRLTRKVSFPKASRLWRLESILGERIAIPSPDLTLGGVPVIVTGVKAQDIGEVSMSFNPYLELPGQNLLLNGDMEMLNPRHFADWWNVGRFDGRAQNGQIFTVKAGRNGSLCVRISRSSAECACDEGPLPVEAGKTYRLTGWIKTENATGANQIGLRWYTGNQWTYVGEVRTENIVGTHDWTKVSLTTRVPDGVSQIRPNIISEKNSGTTWFDDLELIEVP